MYATECHFGQGYIVTYYIIIEYYYRCINMYAAFSLVFLYDRLKVFCHTLTVSTADCAVIFSHTTIHQKDHRAHSKGDEQIPHKHTRKKQQIIILVIVQLVELRFMPYLLLV